MIKCFLSHSSKDKESYVNHVAVEINKESRIIDAESFEAGMETAEEISTKIAESALFVIFISNSALESEWVKIELNKAFSLLNDEKISKIYPILIDNTIGRKDERIPQWMKDKLNLQHISNPKIAARKINARLIEISMNLHPQLKDRNEIFVGRNEAINQLEERLDDYTKKTPAALIVSGLASIGKKSFIRHALKKGNIIGASYEFPVVYLTKQDSIEDFIIKINDSGLVQRRTKIIETLDCSYDKKIDLAIEFTNEIIKEQERVLIHDNGAIVQETGILAEWFTKIISNVANQKYLTYCISSQYRANKNQFFSNNEYFAINIQELDKTERIGLFVRHLRALDITLSDNDISFITGLLTGYPKQILYAVEIIKNDGIYFAKDKSYLIQEYASDKAKVVVELYRDRSDMLDFIYLLSRFDFVSYNVLFDIVDEKTYMPLLQELFNISICEKISQDGDYIRVNDVIRDYVSRNRFTLPTEFSGKIKEHVKSFFNNYNDDSDISNYIFSAKEALAAGEEISDALLLPSMFLKTIKSSYDEQRNYSLVIKLAYRVLQKENNLDKAIVRHIRYILCQSLARTRDKEKFFDEVKKLDGIDKDFLYGFYYRITGQIVKAVESFEKIIKIKESDSRVNGELIIIYLQMDELEKATILAKENYKKAPSNPINLINYAQCLFNSKDQKNKDELKSVLSLLKSNPSQRTQEMAKSTEAKMLFFFDNKQDEAFELIEEAILEFDDKIYPLLTKADIALHCKDTIKLGEAVHAIEKTIQKTAQTYRTFVKYKVFYLALVGNISSAKELIKSELKGMPDEALQKLHFRIDHIDG